MSRNTKIANCTITNNGIRGVYDIMGASVGGIISNTIIWSNGNSELNGSPDVTYCNIKGSWPGEGNTDADPCFVDPDANDYHLLETSPCINTGDPNYIAEPNESDLDGNPRIINGIIDMGAFEFQPLTPVELLLDLTDYISGLSLHGGISNNLQAKLDAAIQKLEDDNENNNVAAVNLLEAFINAVQAQSGKKIAQPDATALIATVQEILELLTDD
jgi:hypothetical protein